MNQNLFFVRIIFFYTSINFFLYYDKCMYIAQKNTEYI